MYGGRNMGQCSCGNTVIFSLTRKITKRKIGKCLGYLLSALDKVQELQSTKAN